MYIYIFFRPVNLESGIIPSGQLNPVKFGVIDSYQYS